MPIETQEAVNWAKEQSVEGPFGIVFYARDDSQLMVDKVREYFNTNGIAYDTFSYVDIKPYI